MLSALLAMIKNDDDKAKFAQIYAENEQLMYRAALRILKNEQDAEDAVSAAFMRLADAPEKLFETGREKSKGYFVTIARHIAFDMYRKQRNHIDEPLDAFEYLLTKRDNIDKFIEHNNITELLSKLPPASRELLILKYGDKYSDTEIAEMLGISESNMCNKISRAKNALKKIIEEAEVESNYD